MQGSEWHRRSGWPSAAGWYAERARRAWARMHGQAGCCGSEPWEGRGAWDWRGRRGDVFGFGPPGRGPRGGDWGRDGPRGPRGFGPGGPGGRQRLFGPGDLQLVLLALIAQQPRHGYELIKAIEERFAGHYTPSPGAVYPTLTLLEEQELVSSASEDGSARRRYTVTEAGTAHLAARQAEVDGVLARLDVAARAMAGRGAPDEIREAMFTLRHALMFHRGEWSAEEVARVRGLIEATARAIVDRPA
ncbi:MAG: PadR family transcriptional regulator [Lautropia sp.]